MTFQTVRLIGIHLVLRKAGLLYQPAVLMPIRNGLSVLVFREA